MQSELKELGPNPRREQPSQFPVTDCISIQDQASQLSTRLLTLKDGVDKTFPNKFEFWQLVKKRCNGLLVPHYNWNFRNVQLCIWMHAILKTILGWKCWRIHCSSHCVSSLYSSLGPSFPVSVGEKSEWKEKRSISGQDCGPHGCIPKSQRAEVLVLFDVLESLQQC